MRSRSLLSSFRPCVVTAGPAAAALLLLWLTPPVVLAQTTVKAHVAANIAPPWNKGIQPISRDSYWHAVECGKTGGAQPACVFYDADLCKNDEFALALYTPYKQVAYEVWVAVSRKQDPPTPSYSAAQKTRVVLGVTPKRRSDNPIASVVVRRGGQGVKPATQTLDGGGGTFIFEFATFAPTRAITIELAGRARTVSCAVEPSVLARFR